MPSKSTFSPAASEDAIRTRAYLLWEADGQPFGRDDHYWSLALAEMAAPVRPKRAAASVKPAAEKKAKAKPAKAVKPSKPKAPVSKSKKSKA